MASKKHYEFQNIFQQGKKFGGEGASISFAAFEKKVIFHRHPESTVILSFTNIHHKGGIMGELRFSGGIMGDLMPNLVRSFRKVGHRHFDVKFI